MAKDYGVKIAKEGFDVKTFLTELNKKDFNILSTENCLLRKKLSSSSSETKMFLGYRLTDTNTVSHPINYTSGDKVYVIYENPMPS